MRRAIVDVECNGLDPSRMWCVSRLDCLDGSVVTHTHVSPRFYEEVKADLGSYEQLIGHDILRFDAPVLRKFVGTCRSWDDEHLIDTLVLSKLIHAGLKSHSVESLGKMLGSKVEKVKVGDDEWDDPSKLDLYVRRCETDVRIQYDIWKWLEKYYDDPEFARAISVEHDTQLLCLQMHKDGFGFDYDKASGLLSEIEEWMAELEEKIIPAVPPRLVVDTPIILKRKKDETPTKLVVDSGLGDASFVSGVSYHRFHYDPFNPRSAEQRVRFLNQCGWKPYEKTKGHIRHERVVRAIQRKRDPNKELPAAKAKLERYQELGWKVSEGNLSTLPDTAPEGAKLLAQWLSLEGRRSDLVEWMAAYVPDTGRIHGKFNGIGAWTHRMAHYNPNLGNIFSTFSDEDIRGDSPSLVEAVKLRYDTALRSCFIARKTREDQDGWLTGTDASGIQLRVLAHYINDEEYSYAVCHGRKEDGTDIHSVDARLLGSVCSGRDNAKTFIYAWILGAGTTEVARILQCSTREAREAVEGFVEGVPGLAKLKRDYIPSVWRAGFFVGLDGRKVIVPSEHHVLAGLLQNGEAVIMKHATVRWKEQLRKVKIQHKLVTFVHDEWQTESYSEGDAHVIGRVQCRSLERVGVDLGLGVPLAGEYSVERNWAETH